MNQIVYALLFGLCMLVPIKQKGIASYYSDKFEGRKTASGEIFRQNKFTAAHRTLPFGTEVRIINLDTGDSVNVVINDRGPFIKGRIIDVSKEAAKRLGFFKQGLANVTIEILNTDDEEI